MGDIHGIPGDVLELIFLLLAWPAHLIHAASTCKRWHNIVADPRFLSLFTSLNARPLIAGSYYNGRYLKVSSEHARPAFVAAASPSPPVVDCRRFSLDFLWSDNVVDSKSWKIVDSRGSLLLWATERYECYSPKWRMDMVVCEPLTRRYKVIPPMVSYSIFCRSRSGPFLLDGDLPGGINLSNFRVICVAYEHHRYCGSMFTPHKLGGSWGRYAMDGQMKMSYFMGRTRGSLYWHAGGRAVTAMDRSTAKLSCSELPEKMEPYWNKQGMELKVTTGRDGEPRILAMAAGGVLRVLALPRGGGDQWELERTIQLSAVAAGLPGYLPSYFAGREESEEVWINVTDAAMVTVSVSTFRDFNLESWAFRLDLETLETELVDIDDGVSDVAFPCELPWPPVLHART
ncbi:hypothetical protein HU200_057164 [Digitaria exilis]|uniref:F-box domain-containing protein n=1 Tax=Digitaria exilis TaxID=1010633 RepID=A0A835AEA5_9POAL|nr:hypothetical protein HU200_057164 [Digitaria exilis]